MPPAKVFNTHIILHLYKIYFKKYIEEFYVICFSCRFHEFESVHKEVSSTLDVLGFLDIADVAGPQTLSRHLVLPRTLKDRQKKKGMTTAVHQGLKIHWS